MYKKNCVCYFTSYAWPWAKELFNEILDLTKHGHSFFDYILNISNISIMLIINVYECNNWLS